MERVIKPRWQPKERTYWSIEQTRRFIEVALEQPDLLGPLHVFLVTTGLRISEALGLRWMDIDWHAPAVRIERALVWRGSTYDILPPKTKAGRRTVSLPQPAIEALRLRPAPKLPNDPFFWCPDERPWRHEQTRDALVALCEIAKVPVINVHGLRHVAAMLAMEASGDVYLVQRRLGHSTIAVTLAVYGYPAKDESSVAPAVNRLLAADE